MGPEESNYRSHVVVDTLFVNIKINFFVQLYVTNSTILKHVKNELFLVYIYLV